MYQRRLEIIFMFALIGVVPRASIADWSSADSSSFSLNLLDNLSEEPPSASDSSTFTLDLSRVNRSSADSGTFAINDTATPAVDPLTILAPSSVAPNVPIAVTITMRNNGGPGDHGGISISLLDLAAQDASMPPYESSFADVAINPASTYSTVNFFDQGDTIYNSIGAPIPAQHLLVEADEFAWAYNETQTLVLAVTPHQPGPLRLRIRGWIAHAGTGYGPPVSRWPEQAGIGREQDQQGFWSQAICVDVAAPAVPGSVEYVGARDLHDDNIVGTGVRIGLLELAIGGDSGKPWDQHYALKDRVTNGLSDPVFADFHSTTVAGVMIGNDSQAVDGGTPVWYRGMVPAATVVCQPSSGFTTIDDRFQDLINAGCEVVNISQGDDPDVAAGIEVERTINDLIDTMKVSCVVATGNLISNPQLKGKIASPAQAYNVIAVGVTQNIDDGAGWARTADENIPGPTSSIWGGSGRSKPDLVAPGGNFERLTHLGDHDVRIQSGPGSSFAAPHVVGAVALLIEASRQAKALGQNLSFVDQYGAVDPRAIKSALLTGADKNVQALLDSDDPFGPTRSWQTGGTQQPLDFSLGAGGLNALDAKQVLLGEPTIDPQGNTIVRETQFDVISWQAGGTGVVIWPLGSITEPSQFTATLVWNAHYDGILLGIELNNLDLYLLRDGTLVPNGWSNSPIDNVEHIYVHLNQSGDYSLEIRYIDQQTNAVDPEPFAISYRLVPDSFCIPGPADMDCNCVLDSIDISLFVQALIDNSLFSGCDIFKVDINGDGSRNGLDIQAFVNLLMAP